MIQAFRVSWRKKELSQRVFLFCLTLFFCLAALNPAPAYAMASRPKPPAVIAGKITDSYYHQPVIGALVKLISLTGKVKAVGLTDQNGAYTLKDLHFSSLGSLYKLKVSKSGFNSVSITRHFKEDKKYVFNFKLKPYSGKAPPSSGTVPPDNSADNYPDGSFRQNEDEASWTIDSKGGEISCLGGKIKLVIPPNALSQPVAITLRALDKTSFQSAVPDKKSLLSIVECLPKDTKFNKGAGPVKLVYFFDHPEVSGTPLELGLYDETLGELKVISRSFVGSTDNYSATFVIEHFSTYGALKGLVSGGSPIGGGVQIPMPDMFTGSYSHAIPLNVPKGRKGIQPGLQLTYRSSNSNSWVGLGFSLEAARITRSTRLGPPTYDDKYDTFYFITDNGTTELVYLIDNLYQAKIESNFTKFFKEADDSWRVVTKDGSVLYLGQSPDSKEGSHLGTFSWYVTRAVDTNKNYIDYHYIKDQNKSYLSRIDYTGSMEGLSPTNSVEFFLEPREDIISSYITTQKITTAKRLKEIQANVNSELAWRYVLEYDYSPDTNRSLLNSVTQYAPDGAYLPAQRFGYQGAGRAEE